MIKVAARYLFGHLRNTAAAALIFWPHCPSGGDEISRGRRAVIASMCQTDQGAWRVFINRAVRNGWGGVKLARKQHKGLLGKRRQRRREQPPVRVCRTWERKVGVRCD
jgi:hypothetical protein